MAIELDCTASEPQWPLVMFNDLYIRRPQSRRRYLRVAKDALIKGLFKRGLNIIDVNCVKFSVLDVLDLGRSLSPIDFFAPAHLHRVQYTYDMPHQLSFDEARDEICELIVRNHWHKHETAEQFLKRFNSYRTMEELIDSLSFYGRWSDAG